MNFSAVILAGGKSQRMRRDKAWLSVGGQPLLARQIEMARHIGPREIFISGKADTNYTQFGCPVLVDLVADAGPLAGIARALKECASPLLLVLAVDMPAMETALLRRLLQNCAGEKGAVPRLDGELEPLAAIYPKTAGALAQKLLREQRRAATGFAAACAESGLVNIFDILPEEAVYFKNWNRPEDVPVP
jgi:molybdopterin-guanine dinucleotide biosynthesis protein A